MNIGSQGSNSQYRTPGAADENIDQLCYKVLCNSLTAPALQAVLTI